MTMALAVLSGFGLAAAAPFLHRLTRSATGWLLALLPAALALWFAGFLGRLPASGGLATSHEWLPSLEIRFSFLLDGWSLLFALLITGIGALILIYAGGYLKGHPLLGRLYAFLLLFMASMLGLVLADNVITLFIFWELTSISSYLLIGFDHERREARQAALQALLVTGAGGLALMAGLLLLAWAGGSYELSTLLDRDLRAHPLYWPILLLVLAGAFTKSAQFPFHFWLPGAMEAPTPVSAYLHSATMVKAGIYLLGRLSPALGGTPEWTMLLTGFGTLTLLTGAWLAMTVTDLKRILAYSTVSALGLLTLLLGVGGSAGLAAAAVFVLAHALYKGTLFLAAGAVDHESGSRDIDQLGGLRRAMPLTALAAGLAALSMAGLPPLFGFMAKELVYEGVLHAVFLTTLTVAASMLFVAIAGIVGLGPFFGPVVETPRHAHEAPISLLLGPLMLAGLGLLLGLAPGLADGPLLAPAAAALRRQPLEPLHLALWHGLNLPLLLSLVTVAGGVAAYLGRKRLRDLPLPDAGPQWWYELSLRGLNGFAQGLTHALQSGYLRYYFMIILTATVLLVGAAWLHWGGGWPVLSWDDLEFVPVGLIALIMAAAVLTIRSQPRLAAIATLGLVGYGVALLFVLLGAPDLAMTQFLIETLTVILFVLVFYHLPAVQPTSKRAARLRDALLAGGVGALMTLLVLLAISTRIEPSIAGYYGEHSQPDGHGQNVVNVILVDFRGLDTLGEITVLAVAGIGVYALLKLRPEGRAEEETPA